MLAKAKRQICLYSQMPRVFLIVTTTIQNACLAEDQIMGNPSLLSTQHYSISFTPHMRSSPNQLPSDSCLIQDVQMLKQRVEPSLLEFFLVASQKKDNHPGWWQGQCGYSYWRQCSSLVSRDAGKSCSLQDTDSTLHTKFPAVILQRSWSPYANSSQIMGILAFMYASTWKWSADYLADCDVIWRGDLKCQNAHQQTSQRCLHFE